MPVEAAIFDLDGTILRESGVAVPGIRDAIDALRDDGLRIAVATNRGRARAASRLRSAEVDVDLIIDANRAGGRKPSPKFVDVALDEFSLARHQLVYIGDDDTTDAPLAVNAKVLYLAARWSDPSLRYGLPVDTPDSVVRFIRRFLRADPIWYWKHHARDRRSREIHVQALLPSTRDSTNLKSVLKFGNDPIVQGLRYRGFLFRRLLTALYLDGDAGDIDTWTWYPTSDGRPKNARFHEFFDQASKCFRAKHIEDLLTRHKTATKSAFARSRGSDPGFINQTNTVHVNARHRNRVEGKRVLVMDDFCTAGYSFECARNLLLLAGASRVDCVSFGRYHDEYLVKSLKPASVWNPWKPAMLKETDFSTVTVLGVKQVNAVTELERLLKLSK